MKKILAIAIVAIMMLSLVSCGAKTQEVGGLSIDLPMSYVDAADILEKIIGENAFDTVDMEMRPYVSLVDGMAVVVAHQKGDGSAFDDYKPEDFDGYEYEDYDFKLLEVNGQLAYEFSEDLDGQRIKCLSVFYGDDVDSYMVLFVCNEDEYESKKDKMVEYASTVVID